MNRVEFMRELEHLLLDIPGEEREEALRYYDDYFEDAGILEEDRIMEELGTPAKVAKQIKSNLYSKDQSNLGEFTERGYHVPLDEEKYEVSYENTGKKDTTKTMLLIALALCTSPIWIGLVGGIFGLIMGLIGGLVGLVFGCGAAFIGFLIGSVGSIIWGIFNLSTAVGASMVAIGIGCLCITFAMLFLQLTLLLVRSAIPSIIRGITSICSNIFNKKRGVKA